MNTPLTFRRNGFLYKSPLIKKNQIDEITEAVLNGATKVPLKILGYWDRLCSKLGVTTDRKLAADNFFTIVKNDFELQNPSLSTEDKDRKKNKITAACAWLKGEIATEYHQEFSDIVQTMTEGRVTVQWIDEADQSIIKTFKYQSNSLDSPKAASEQTITGDSTASEKEYDTVLGELTSSLPAILSVDPKKIDFKAFRSQIGACFAQENIRKAQSIIEKLAKIEGTANDIAVQRVNLINDLLRLAKGKAEDVIKIQVTQDRKQLDGKKVGIEFKLFGISSPPLECDEAAVAPSLTRYENLKLLSWFEPGNCSQAMDLIHQFSAKQSMASKIRSMNELIKLAKDYRSEKFQIEVSATDEQRKQGKVKIGIKIAGVSLTENECNAKEVASSLADYRTQCRIHSFTVKNGINASKIIAQISPKNPISANIKNINKLVIMAKAGTEGNFQVAVSADADQIKRGKVKVGIKLFNEQLFDTECDATEVAGSLMGYENSDPKKIAEEMTPQEKELLAKVLVTLNDLESVNKGKDDVQVKQSFKERIGDVCYQTYRPGEKSVAKLDSVKYPVKLKGGANKFDPSLHGSMKGLSPGDENVFSIFANIGYEKNKDGEIVKFFKVHPLLAGILGRPSTDRQTILEIKPNGEDTLKNYREINSAKFDSSDVFYKEFSENQKTLQPFLTKLYDDHHQTLNIVYNRLSRNIPIAPKQQGAWLALLNEQEISLPKE